MIDQGIDTGKGALSEQRALRRAGYVGVDPRVRCS